MEQQNTKIVMRITASNEKQREYRETKGATKKKSTEKQWGQRKKQREQQERTGVTSNKKSDKK